MDGFFIFLFLGLIILGIAGPLKKYIKKEAVNEAVPRPTTNIPTAQYHRLPKPTKRSPHQRPSPTIITVRDPKGNTQKFIGRKMPPPKSGSRGFKRKNGRH